MALPPRHGRRTLQRAGYFVDVSCTSPQMCVAVGYDQCFAPVIERWNGQRWTLQPFPGARCTYRGSTFFSVSCVSTHWCLALGHVLEVWNGRRWRTAGRLKLDGGETWCVGPRACVFAGLRLYASVVGSFDARGPHPSVWGRELGVPTGLTDVSCMSPRSCLAVGSVGNSPTLARWTGHRWVNAVLPTPDTYLRTIACSAKSCLAFGYQGPSTAWTWDGRSWSAQATAMPSSLEVLPRKLSCLGSRCVVVLTGALNQADEIWQNF